MRDRRACSHRRRRALTTLLVALSLVAASAQPGHAALPVNYSTVYALGGALNPNTPPTGANDWTCKPTAAHPRPVVLVHGTFANENDNWTALSPLLVNSGYCVFALDYGGPALLGTAYGVGDIATSAAQLGGFVDQVLATTGAAKVDVVGHSQGGMMPRYYLKFLGGAAKVQNLIGLAPSNHGSNAYGLVKWFPGLTALASSVISLACVACAQQISTSPFLANLNAGGDTVPGVQYTVIETRYDEVVTPYTSAFLAGANVHNMTVQDGCWLDFSEHVSLAWDHIALRLVMNALDPATALNPGCSFVAWGLGG